MGEELALENGRISDFQGLVTLTLDRVILHTVTHHSSTSTYTQISLKLKKLYTHCIRSTRRSKLLLRFIALISTLSNNRSHALNNSQLQGKISETVESLSTRQNQSVGWWNDFCSLSVVRQLRTCSKPRHFPLERVVDEFLFLWCEVKQH